MPDNDHIITEAREYVGRLLREKLKLWVTYHDIRHTRETAEASVEISAACGLDSARTEIVVLAAWFHDTGYTQTAKGHEARGAAIAEAFLARRNYPPEKIRLVVECIMATVVPQRPKNLLGRVICDADMLYIGRKEFFRKNDLLKLEIEKREGVKIDAAEWLDRSLRFLEAQAYHTDYCREKLTEGLRENIAVLRKQLDAGR